MAHQLQGKALQVADQGSLGPLLLLCSCKHEAQHAHMGHRVCWGTRGGPQEAIRSRMCDATCPDVLQGEIDGGMSVVLAKCDQCNA